MLVSLRPVPLAVPRGGAYNRLSKRDKTRAHLTSIRPNPVPCPACGTLVDPRPEQLAAHAPRCPGRVWGADPDQAVVWMGWGEIRALGVSWGALRHWLFKGYVRRVKREGRWVYSRVEVTAATAKTAARREAKVNRAKRAGALRRWYQRRGE